MAQAIADAESENRDVVQLGKYRLLALIARGGMGDIYLAMSEGPAGFRKLVVVKVLRTDADEEEAYRSMFLDEGLLAARLNHPNVVQTHEVGDAQGQLFIAMEYLEGQPLSRVMRAAGRIPPALAARMVADALCGLHHAHELRDFDGTPLNIVHRDLSPQNVFVTYDGVVKLVDFGIAKAALVSRAMTEVGVLKGKISYMAPEHANGGAVDRRADVFAMGIVLWELVSGRRLFDTRHASQALRALLDPQPFPRLSAVCGVDAPALEGIVARALEKQPELRYQSADEMRVDLDAYIAQADPTIRNEHIAQFVIRYFSGHRDNMRQQVRTCVAAAPESGEHLPIIGARARSKTESSGMTQNQLTSHSERMSSRGPPTSGRMPIEQTITATGSSRPGEFRLNVSLGDKRVAAGVLLVLLLAGAVFAFGRFGNREQQDHEVSASRPAIPAKAAEQSPLAPPAPDPSAPRAEPPRVAAAPVREVLPTSNEPAPRRAIVARPAVRPAARPAVRPVLEASLTAAAVPNEHSLSREPAPRPAPPSPSPPSKRGVELVDDSDGVTLVE
jgi:serine/threonine-protein kinase